MHFIHQSAERRGYRCWLYVGKGHFRFELAWLHSLGPGISLSAGGYEDDWTLGITLPWLLAVWFAVPGSRVRDREVSVRLHGGSLYWNFWTPSMEWSSKTPRWRNGSFNFVDLVLGRSKYSEREVETRDVLVPMPEGAYPAKAMLREDTWRRPRWPWARRLMRVSIDIPGGIPKPGKGENSWDCGDDATMGITTPARSIPEGVGRLVGSVLSDRVRRGGWRDWTWSRESEAA